MMTFSHAMLFVLALGAMALGDGRQYGRAARLAAEAMAEARAMTNLAKPHEGYERIERAYMAAFALDPQAA